MDELIENSSDKTFYRLRYTPHPQDKQTVQQHGALLGLLINRFAPNYLMGKEFEKNWHYHAVFLVDEPFNNAKEKEFRDHLYTMMNVPKGKKGNPTYSLSIALEPHKSLPYAVKDGDFTATDEWMDIAQDAYALSFEKPQGVKSGIASLSEKYKKKEICERVLWIELGKIRAQLGLPLSLKWCDDMTLSIKVNADPNLLQEIWEDREIRKNNK